MEEGVGGARFHFFAQLFFEMWGSKPNEGVMGPIFVVNLVAVIANLTIFLFCCVTRKTRFIRGK